MPFKKTPQQRGCQDAIVYLAEAKPTKEAFMEEGREMSKQYSDEQEQQRYLEGWEYAWPQTRGSQSNRKDNDHEQ